jgi:hypothetical protein
MVPLQHLVQAVEQRQTSQWAGRLGYRHGPVEPQHR